MKHALRQVLNATRALGNGYRHINLKRTTSTALRFDHFTKSFSTSASYRQKNVRDMFSLSGRNYIVTGGGQGIGFAMTQAICQMGGNVAVLDLRDAPVEAFSSLSSQHNVRTEYFQADVTNEQILTKAFDNAVSALGSVHGLIPAAGITIDKPFLEQTWDEVSRLQQVNIVGTFFAAQLTARQLLKQGTPGSMVLIASHCAHQTAPGHHLSAYHATKGGVLMLGKALAVELAPHNIRVNSISPGYINSDMTQKLRVQYPHLVEIMHKVPPMKRIGQPEDLTGAAVYLLSDASGYTTGTDILITGGLHAGRIEANSI